MAAAKVALYQILLGQPEDKAGLAERIGLTESALDQLVDLDQRSPIGQVEDALRALGLALHVEVSAVYPASRRPAGGGASGLPGA